MMTPLRLPLLPPLLMMSVELPMLDDVAHSFPYAAQLTVSNDYRSIRLNVYAVTAVYDFVGLVNDDDDDVADWIVLLIE